MTLMEDLINRRWLPLGLVVLLTGLFWATNGSLYTKLYYGLIALPALLGLIVAPRIALQLIREPLVLAFLLLAAWLLASLAWTQSDASVGSLAKRPLYVLMLFAACALIVRRNPQLLLRTLQVGALVAAFAALVNVVLFALNAPSANDRLIGTGALRNPLLSSHVFGFFCVYWLASWVTERPQRWWYSLCAFPLLVALLATGSRTPLLALAFTGIWLLALIGRRALPLVLGLTVAGALALTLAPDILLQRGLSFRPQLWSEALSQAANHPWIGYGYNSPFTFDIPAVGYPLMDPHNVELAVLLELGVVGLGLWFGMYGLALWRCVQLRRLPPFQLASALMIYGLMAGLTEGSNFLSRPNENWFLIWIPLALLAALSISQRESADHEKP